MTRESDLDRKLKQRRRLKAQEDALREALAILRDAGLNVSEEDAVPAEQLEPLWSRYVERLKASAEGAERWPEDQVDRVSKRVAALGESIGADRVLWFWPVPSAPVAIEVTASDVLTGGPPLFATRAHDLMVSGLDAEHGVCLELNASAGGNEYELARWGSFVEQGPA